MRNFSTLLRENAGYAYQKILGMSYAKSNDLVNAEQAV